MSRNQALYAVLRIAAWALPAFPLPVAYALAAFTGAAAFYLLPGPRNAVLENLARVMAEDRRSMRVRRAAREAFKNDARNWIDTLRISRLSEQEIIASVEVDGWENVEEALGQGRGAIIAMMHLGNFDLVGQAVVARGCHLTIPVERMEPEALFEFLLAHRRSKGINIVPIHRGPRALIAALRRGEIVGVAADRYIGGSGTRVTFFGAETILPRGPVSLARHTGAPLVIGVGLRSSIGRYRGIVTPPLALQRTGDPERDDRENVRRLAAVMEGFIGLFPDQWLAFSPVWPRGSDGEGPATMKNHVEAAV